MSDDAGGGAMNYVRAGRWSQCTHCGGIYDGAHYCGAPWQTPSLGYVVGEGIDEIPPSWVPVAPPAPTGLTPEQRAACGRLAEEIAQAAKTSPVVAKLFQEGFPLRAGEYDLILAALREAAARED